MAGETILIVDDTPVSLKLTRILLVNEGYRVHTATSAEEALEMLPACSPDLIVADIQLPGIDGLEMTRRIKADPATRNIPVVALTAFAMKGDEQIAYAAGCDGYITKPIETRTLGALIRSHLDHPGEPRSPAPQPPSPAAEMMSTVEMQQLRRRFLDEGLERTRQILLELEGAFDAAAALHLVHQWAGAGTLLGYAPISRAAREVESLLREKPLDSGQLRESLTNLMLVFSSPHEVRVAPLPEAILQALAGKFVAVVGLLAPEAERLCIALESAHARLVFFELNALPQPELLETCDLVVIQILPDSHASPWLDPSSPVAARPAVFVGARDHLMALDPHVQTMAREFLMDSWQPEEALVRLSLAISRPAAGSRPPRTTAERKPTSVLVADPDSMVLALARTALESVGMSCIQCADGPAALELARTFRPAVAVLDVNAPAPGGYQLLTAIRKEEIPTRVLLLTTRQQETGILQGFTLGADDYLVKPFSPMELVARIKRLL